MKVYGPGHVIAHNSIAYFHDAIGISTYGTPENDPDRRASSIDIYNNDLHMLNDDFIETDGGVHNVRVFNNRGVNAAQGGYRAQPVFGGPVYFFRNLLYHVPSGVAFKFSAKPAGLLRVSQHDHWRAALARLPQRNTHFRNNLFLGRDTPDRGIMAWPTPPMPTAPTTTASAPTEGVEEQYSWLGPRATRRRPSTNQKSEDWQIFPTLADFATATGQETHGVEVDFDIFEKLAPPDPAPQARHAVYHAMDLNFRLKPNSKAVDAGSFCPLSTTTSRAGP